MPDTPEQNPEPIPDDQPMVADGIPPSYRRDEIKRETVYRLRQFAPTKTEIDYLADNDKCLRSLYKLLEKTEKLAVTSPEARKKLEWEAAAATSRWLRTFREKEWKQAKLDDIRCRIRQRRLAIADMEEARRIRAVRLKVGFKLLHLDGRGLRGLNSESRPKPAAGT